MNSFPTVPLQSFFVLPDDGLEPLLEPARAAQRTIEIYVYKFTNREIKDALADAVRRGVQVRAIVERAPSNEEKAGAAAMHDLQQIGVDARWRPDYFVKSHAKSYVVDGQLALIASFNFVDDWNRLRDHGITTSDAGVIAGFGAVFEADWQQQPLAQTPPLPLVLSPHNSRATVHDLIAAAEHEILIEHEQITDPTVVEWLHQRILAGVMVRLTTNADDKANAQAIAPLRHLGPHFDVNHCHDLDIHAKLLIVDRRIMLLGSINLTAESLDQRREVSLLVSDPVALNRARLLLSKDFQTD